MARVRNLADFLARGEGRPAPGSTARDADGVPYAQPGLRRAGGARPGLEGRGLRPRVAQTCDELVALPLRGKIESLNVSAAAAALVYGVLQLRTQAT